MDNISIGWTVVIAVITIVGSILAAWLTARGNRYAAKTGAEATVEIGLGNIDNSRIEILLRQYEGLAAVYQKDRADDAKEIADLKIDVQRQGLEILDLRGKFPKYRAEIRRLRTLVTSLGGKPGPWPSDLE